MLGNRRNWIFALFGLLIGCTSNTSNNPPPPSSSQWVCFHCSGMSVASNGSFAFPPISGAVGYIYTAASGNPSGKTITLDYTVSGTGTILPSAASGTGKAQLRLFLWRKNDDLACSSTTEWYRWWSASAGDLTVGHHTVTAVVVPDQWTDCYARKDANQFAATTANLLGIGFTFGAEFFGHGVYSTGSNNFTINSFTVQ